MPNAMPLLSNLALKPSLWQLSGWPRNQTWLDAPEALAASDDLIWSCIACAEYVASASLLAWSIQRFTRL